MSNEDVPVTTASILEMMQAMVGQMRDSVSSNLSDITTTIIITNIFTNSLWKSGTHMMPHVWSSSV